MAGPLAALGMMGPMASSLVAGGAAGGAGMMSWLGPLLGAGIGGGASLGGGLLSGGASRQSASSQERFQKWMYAHRYRMAMKDLRLAGINPMLAAELGGGSVPGGSSFQLNNPLEGVANSARDMAQTIANLRLTESQIDAVNANAQSARSTARVNTAEAKLREAAVPKAELVEEVQKDITERGSHLWDKITKELDDRFGSGSGKITEEDHRPSKTPAEIEALKLWFKNLF